MEDGDGAWGEAEAELLIEDDSSALKVEDEVESVLGKVRDEGGRGVMLKKSDAVCYDVTEEGDRVCDWHRV